MKKIYLFLFILLFSGIVHAKHELPKLDVFAKHSVYKNMKISPTGKYIAFTYEKGDQVNLAIMEKDTKKVLSSFDFGKNRHVVQFQWLNNERVGMFIQTVIGWLDGTNPKTEFAAANADGSNRRILWDSLNNSRVKLVSRLKAEPEFVLLQKQHWTEAGKITLMKMNIENASTSNMMGLPESARHTNPGIIAVDVDLNGDIRVAYEFDRGKDEVDDKDDRWYLHIKDTKNQWQKLDLKSARSKPKVVFLGMSANNNKVYFKSNHDMAKSDTLGLFELDLKSKKIKFIYRHQDVDVLSGLYGSKDQLIGITLEPGYPEKFYIENAENKADIALMKGMSGAFKNQASLFTSRTENDQLSIVYVYSDRNPGDFYLYDHKGLKLSYFASTKPEVNPKQMARVEPFTMQARDGVKMYGQLTIPNNVEEKNLPLVVYPHGGPYGVADRWGWDGRAQMLASRGYLVMQLNFRGSGGYGTDFKKLGYSEWGAKMQDDITDATKWAINSGLAAADRICIHGVSYGGYASMNAVVKEPELYRCAIPDAGPYELNLQWDEADSFKGKNGSERREWYIKRSIGGSQNNDERSPVYHLDKLKAKLFIVHGAEDVRVPIENAYLLEEKLKEKGISYEKLYKDSEGHGFTKEKNRVELYSTILAFLKKHIGEGAKPKSH